MDYYRGLSQAEWDRLVQSSSVTKEYRDHRRSTRPLPARTIQHWVDGELLRESMEISPTRVLTRAEADMWVRLTLLSIESQWAGIRLYEVDTGLTESSQLAPPSHRAHWVELDDRVFREREMVRMRLWHMLHSGPAEPGASLTTSELRSFENYKAPPPPFVAAASSTTTNMAIVSDAQTRAVGQSWASELSAAEFLAPTVRAAAKHSRVGPVHQWAQQYAMEPLRSKLLAAQSVDQVRQVLGDMPTFVKAHATLERVKLCESALLKQCGGTLLLPSDALLEKLAGGATPDHQVRFESLDDVLRLLVLDLEKRQPMSLAGMKQEVANTTEAITMSFRNAEYTPITVHCHDNWTVDIGMMGSSGDASHHPSSTFSSIRARLFCDLGTKQEHLSAIALCLESEGATIVPPSSSATAAGASASAAAVQ